MIYFKECRKCGGDIELSSDSEFYTIRCFSCGTKVETPIRWLSKQTISAPLQAAV